MSLKIMDLSDSEFESDVQPARHRRDGFPAALMGGILKQKVQPL